MKDRRNSKKAVNTALLVAICIMLSLLLACSSSDDTNDNPWDTVDGDQETENLVDGDSELAESFESDNETDIELGENSLSGIWGLKFSVAYTTILPIVNCKVQLVLTGIAKLMLDHKGFIVDMSEDTCEFKMDTIENMDFYIQFPQNEIDAVPLEQMNAELSDLKTGEVFTIAETVAIYGADETQFENPRDDILPNSPDDPTVVNFGDENPGITANLTGFVSGDVYVVFRMRRNMIGTIKNQNLIEGQMTSLVEMMTIGASNPILNIQLDLTGHDEPGVNRFQMVRLQEDLSCVELVRTEAQVFSYDQSNYAVPIWTGDECPKVD